MENMERKKRKSKAKQASNISLELAIVTSKDERSVDREARSTATLLAAPSFCSPQRWHGLALPRLPPRASAAARASWLILVESRARS